MFFKGSRYEKVGDAQYTAADGRVFRYKRIRFLPDTPARFNHLVTQGERPDLLAFHYYQDSLKFWHVADANGDVMQAEELTAEPGRRILIPPDTP